MTGWQEKGQVIFTSHVAPVHPIITHMGNKVMNTLIRRGKGPTNVLMLMQGQTSLPFPLSQEETST